jgi:hypothetical protein
MEWDFSSSNMQRGSPRPWPLGFFGNLVQALRFTSPLVLSQSELNIDDEYDIDGQNISLNHRI